MIIGISGKMGVGKDLVGSILQYLTTPEGSNEFTLDDYINDSSSYLYAGNNWEIKKFADKLKDITCILLGCTRAQLEDREFKEKELGEEWDLYNLIAGNNEFYALNQTLYELKNNFTKTYEQGRYKTETMTPRKILQLLGTEAGRQIIHPNIWVNALMSEYKSKGIYDSLIDNRLNNPYHFPNWIITDVRFPNELKAVKDRDGITIRIERKPRVVVDGIEYFIGTDGIPEHASETALDNAEFDYVVQNDGTIEELIEKIKCITKELTL